MIRDYADRQEHVAGLVERYRDGSLSEEVFRVSLGLQIRSDEIMMLLVKHQAAHRNSPNYKRGIVT